MSSFRQNQDRNFEPQRYRARSPNLVTAIVLWNTMYLERITWGWSRQVGGRRAAAIPVAAGLGAHQPDWRLRLAAEPQAGGREVQAATIARKTLAYDFFRILRAPLYRTLAEPSELARCRADRPWPADRRGAVLVAERRAGQAHPLRPGGQ